MCKWTPTCGKACRIRLTCPLPPYRFLVALPAVLAAPYDMWMLPYRLCEHTSVSCSFCNLFDFFILIGPQSVSHEAKQCNCSLWSWVCWTLQKPSDLSLSSPFFLHPSIFSLSVSFLLCLTIAPPLQSFYLSSQSVVIMIDVFQFYDSYSESSGFSKDVSDSEKMNFEVDSDVSNADLLKLK